MSEQQMVEFEKKKLDDRIFEEGSSIFNTDVKRRGAKNLRAFWFLGQVLIIIITSTCHEDNGFFSSITKTFTELF